MECSSSVYETLKLIKSRDPCSKIYAAKEIRRLAKSSQHSRRRFYPAIEPLVDMLRSDCLEFNHAAILALLNLAVKDETYLFYLFIFTDTHTVTQLLFEYYWNLFMKFKYFWIIMIH